MCKGSEIEYVSFALTETPHTNRLYTCNRFPFSCSLEVKLCGRIGWIMETSDEYNAIKGKVLLKKKHYFEERFEIFI